MTSLTFNRIPKCHYQGIGSPDGEPQRCAQCITRKLNHCGALNMELGARLEAIVTKSRFERGQTLFTQDESADYIFSLVAGVVSCSHYLDDGRRQIIAFLFPGDYIGMTIGARYCYSAEAVTEGEYCRFPRETFTRLLTTFDDFEQHCLLEVSNELAEAQKHVLVLGQKDATERVASFLLMLDERENSYGDQDDIELPMLRADIADYLGLTIETVSRTMTKLRSRGLIAAPNAHIVRILDRDKLRGVASN